MTTALHVVPNVPLPPDVLQHDVDWNDWYNVLQDYLFRGTQILPNDLVFFWTMVQATGWAFIVLYAEGGLGRHRLLLFVLLTVVLFTVATQFLSGYFYSKNDRLLAPDFTARLVAEIRAREDAASNTTALAPPGA